MKTIILYYSFGGATKAEAERLSAELGAETFRVEERKKRNLLRSFIPGCPQALRRTAVPVKLPLPDLTDFERILIGCPVWAGCPAPAFNSIAALLPAGKEVGIFLCSGGGDSKKSEQKTRELVESRGCTVVSYRDIRTDAKPGKRA